MAEHKHMVEFNSNYMQYQRNKIRSLELKLRAYKIILFFMVIFIILVVHQYIGMQKDLVKIQLENRTLHQTIQEKNALIDKQTKEIKDKGDRIKTLESEFSVKLQDAVKEICGNTVDKAIGTVYLEATNQDQKGMQLIADTIWNRVRSEKFSAKSVAEVLLYPTQFNVLPHIPKITKEEKQSPQYLLASQVVWDKILYDKTESSKVLYFMNPESSAASSRGWMRTKHLVLRYKDHEFYE